MGWRSESLVDEIFRPGHCSTSTPSSSSLDCAPSTRRKSLPPFFLTIFMLDSEQEVAQKVADEIKRQEQVREP